MTPAHGVSRLHAWLALWTVYIVWGSTYVGIRVMVETIPPFLAGALRYAAAGLLMAAWIVVRRGPARMRVAPRELAAAAVVALLLLPAGNGVLIVAEQDVPAGLSSLIIAAVPLWVIVFRLVLRDRPAPATVGGVLLGFTGVAVLLIGGHRPDNAPVGGLLLVLLASFSWALGSLLAGRLPMPKDAAAGTAWEMLIGGAAMAVLSMGFGEHVPQHVSARSAVAVAYLVVFGSLVAFTAYVWLLQHVPISQVATYAYVNPIVAVALGMLLLGESLTAGVLIGGAVIVVAVLVVVTVEGRAQTRARRVAPAAEPATAET